MKLPLHFIGLLVFTGAAFGQGKGVGDIASPAKRVATIDLAEKLGKLHIPPEAKVAEGVTNPFDPSALSGPSSSHPISDHDIIAVLAGQLNPTGTVVLGGEPYLLFGQKRIKVGEKIPISFENAVYDLEIVAIERITFTVRYNREELSRPVTVSSTNKTGKNP
jgi:hypothetical protein